MSNITPDSEPLHTEEMQDIIGASPSWLLRWGITIFFIMLIIISSVSQIIKYPDIVKTSLKIRTLDLPISIACPTNGKVFKILVKNNELVNAKKILAIIQSNVGNINLSAPKTGIVSYYGMIYENQEVFANEPLFRLNQAGPQFFGELRVSESSLGKVKVGQGVLVKMKSYPYQQYGMLHGIIKYIVENPTKDGEYEAMVDFRSNITDTHRSLLLQNGMMADVDIITENNSLLQRLTNNIFSNFRH